MVRTVLFDLDGTLYDRDALVSQVAKEQYRVFVTTFLISRSVRLSPVSLISTITAFVTQPDTSLGRELRELEESHLRSGVRSSAHSIGALLADDFIEFGSSGQVIDRASAIASVSREAAFQSQIDDFVVRVLAPGVVLTTYRLSARSASESRTRVTLRSSVWIHRAGRWSLLFHQGTLVHD
jgi:hypothetical protein